MLSYLRRLTFSVLAAAMLLGGMGIYEAGGAAFAAPAMQDQGQNSDPQEIFLSFSYRGVSQQVITALYYDNQVYLPVSELFSLLQISHNTNLGNLTISGSYLSGEQQFELVFDDRGDPRGQVGDRQVLFGAADFLVGELDFYLLPKHFQSLFGLNFQVDLNSLALSLQTDNVLPVVQQLERERRRSQITEQRQSYDYYDLRYGRERHFLRAGFIDYSLNTQMSLSDVNLYNYTLDVGGELVGGDVQGSIFGGYNSASGFNSFTNNLRWRYVPGIRNVISTISVGQVRSMGLLNRGGFRGIRISNEDIQPQILFQDYVIDGSTVPESEVEVYLNNSLIAFEEADMTGYYRFQVPLTYGTTQLSLRIFKPDGSVETQNRRVQIPYSFLKPGQFQYNVSAGRAESSLFSDQNEYWQGNASASMGVAPWLTLRTGAEYLEADTTSQPLFYGSLSTRLASNYLVNIDIAPDAFYRIDGSAVYASSASLNASYIYYTRNRSLFNPTSVQEEIRGSVFVPFNVFGTPLSMRLLGNNQKSLDRVETIYQADLSARFGRLNSRVSFRDRQSGRLQTEFTNDSQVSATLNYIFPRGPNTSSFFKGLYLRSQVNYLPYQDQLSQGDFQIAKDLGENVRLQLSFRHHFLRNQTSGQINLTLNLDKVRSNSITRVSQNRGSFSQNLRGSIGYDGNYNELYLTDRRQVGQGAASVRLYVDENNSDSYTEGEQVLPYNAVRLQRSGRTQLDEDGIIRITQIQSYYRHNLEINYAALRNPTYVPKVEQFSFIADPNQFKQIDIPFYITGILEGTVYRQQGGSRQPAAGVRLYLISEDGQFEKTFNTFSDGSFYTYEVPPGQYNLLVDPEQLQRLNAETLPDTLDLSVEAVEDGDYISGLDFTIVPEGTQRREIIAQDSARDRDILTPTEVYGDYTHRVQLASFSTRANAEQAMQTASEQFNIPLAIEETNNLFALRTLPIQSRQQAITLLHRIADSQFSQPVLVLTLPASAGAGAGEQAQQTEEVISQVYSLQIGAFSTRDAAGDFASRVGSLLGGPATVAYDSTRQLYKVYADSRPYSSIQEAREELTRLRDQTDYDGAFIDRRTIREEVAAARPEQQAEEPSQFTYEVHIQGVSDISRERFLSAAITSDFNLLSNGPEEELVVFQNVQDWQTAVDLSTKLSRIAGMGQPFIVLVEVRDQ